MATEYNDCTCPPVATSSPSGKGTQFGETLEVLYRCTEVDHVIQHWGLLFSCCIFKADVVVHCRLNMDIYPSLAFSPPEQYSFVLSLVVKGGVDHSVGTLPAKENIE